MKQHPSPLALDRIHLGLGQDEDRAHAAECAQCRGYLERLAAPVVLPEELRARMRKRLWWPWGVGGAVLVAAAATVALVAAQPTVPLEEVRVKGSPVASLFVRRGTVVNRWTGDGQVQIEDALRLEVQPEGYGWLTVFDHDQVLRAAPVLGPRVALEQSWRVAPGTTSVELRLVFSRSALGTEEALAAWRRSERSTAIWTTSLLVPVADAGISDAPR